MFPEATPEEIRILNEVKPYTMTSWERLWALIQAARYVHDRNIPGDIVECGVWRGGSSMAAALALRSVNDTARSLWLFDTFEGMTRPSSNDTKVGSGEPAMDKWLRTKTGNDASDWCAASLDDVRSNLDRTGYPRDRVHLIQGKVEDTLRVPANIPDQVAILRLDTDWYESTKVELETLFDKLATGGVLIVDDYGAWAGSKKAVDEFLSTRPRYFMNRIDAASRILIKA
jgi:O-methyltransferase